MTMDANGAAARAGVLPDEDDEDLGGPVKVGENVELGASKCDGKGARVAGVDSLVALLATKETELRVLQKTHDEYVKSSCDYEKELEGEIERYEKKSSVVEQLVQGLEESKAALQSTLAQVQSELVAAKKREELAQAQVQEMKRRIQQLEQTNDELETANRVALASMDELQHRVDTLTEENVFLLQEKEDAMAAAASEEKGPRDATESVPNGAHDARVEVPRKVSGATGYEPSNFRPKDRRKSARFPEVVESCLHMTCTNTQCRRNHHVHVTLHTDVAPTSPTPAVIKREKTKKGFFDRLRQRFMSK